MVVRPTGPRGRDGGETSRHIKPRKTSSSGANFPNNMPETLKLVTMGALGCLVILFVAYWTLTTANFSPKMYVKPDASEITQEEKQLMYEAVIGEKK